MKRWLRAALTLLLCSSLAGAGRRPPPVLADPSPAHAGRLIVKYGARVTECAHCLLAGGTPFAQVTGSGSLDQLHRRFGVVSARALFQHQHVRSGRAAAYHDMLEAVRARFPERAARAPRGAAPPDLSNVFVLEINPSADPALAAAEFSKDPDVEWAEPDYRMEVSLVPDDPFFSSSGSVGPFPDLWGLHAIQADSAWDVTNGSGTVVAVVDTGVKYTHPDLRDNAWTNPGEIPNNHIDDDGNGFVDDVYGWDFLRASGKPKDRHGHGTHVAGTIAAAGNNGLGVVGVAWGARVMAVRGLDAHGSGFSSDLAEGIAYAAENGADVINNSWGGGDSSTVRAAVDTATGLGAVVVFAAGNSSSAYLGQASDPDVIAVAATEYGDTRASFSNYGPAISVAAPGIDILSTSGPGRVGGQVVGGPYRVLSGTSMAAPHTSGVAALLLSVMPGLTLDEVRWHLELNADQPGSPGYEGQRWNPFFGFGRVNAARVFDQPPVTTRLTTPPFTLHGFAGAIEPDVAAMAFLFTTLDPVAWTASGPPWLVPEVASGNGPATVSLTLDGTGLAADTYTGNVVIDLPTAIDGGASVAATAYLHTDPRVGGEIEVTNSFYGYGGGPRLASDGQGVFATWVEFPPSGRPNLVGAYVDAAGTVTGPFPIDVGTCIEAFCYIKEGSHVAAAFDGTNFLVVWHEYIDGFVSDTSYRRVRHDYVKAVRVTSAGTVLGPPVVVGENQENAHPNNSYDQFFYNVAVAFDGTGYSVLWGQLNFGTTYANATKIYLRRVGLSGDLLTAVSQIYPASDTVYPQFVEPKIACVTGSCLVAWHEADGETSPQGKYIDKLYGRRFDGTVPIDSPPFRILTDIESIDVIASNGSGYLMAGFRATLCPGPSLCGYDVVAARATAGGVALDPDGIRLNRSAPNGFQYLIYPNSVAFDGTNYIVTWGELGANVSDFPCYLFAARVGPDGSVVDDEPEGSLLLPSATFSCNDPAIASVATKSLIAYLGGGNPGRIVAQGVFPH